MTEEQSLLCNLPGTEALRDSLQGINIVLRKEDDSKLYKMLIELIQNRQTHYLQAYKIIIHVQSFLMEKFAKHCLYLVDSCQYMFRQIVFLGL